METQMQHVKGWIIARTTREAELRPDLPAHPQQVLAQEPGQPQRQRRPAAPRHSQEDMGMYTPHRQCRCTRAAVFMAACALILGLVSGVVEVVGPSPVQAAPPSVITWTPASVVQTLLVGTSSTVPVSFTAARRLNDAVVLVAPALQPYVQVNPSSFGSIPKGQTIDLNVTIAASASALPGTFEGVIQVGSGVGNLKTYETSLPVTVTVELPPPVPTTTQVVGQEDGGVQSGHQGVTLPVVLEGSDPYTPGADLAAAITALPAVGQLWQWDDTPITAPNIVTDAQRRVKFVVPGDANGDPLAFFSYTLTSAVSGRTSAPARVNVIITPVPDRPVATTPKPSTLEDTPLLFQFTGRDADSPTDPLTAFVMFAPVRGALYQVGPDNVTPGARIGDGEWVTNPAGWVYYVPPPNVFGSPFSSVAYFMQDSTGLRSIAVLPIHITPVNDGPFASSQTYTGFNNDPNTELFLAITDVEIDAITVCFTALPARGRLYAGRVDEQQRVTAANNCWSNGVFIFQADEPFEWDSPYATFSYFATDPGGLSTGEVTDTINILYRNLPPVSTTPPSLTTAEDTRVPVLFTGSDPDTNPVGFTIHTLPQHGWLLFGDFAIEALTTFGEGIVLEYLPFPDFNTLGTTPDFILFTVSDQRDTNPTIYQLDLVVTAVNDAPTVSSNGIAVMTVSCDPQNFGETLIPAQLTMVSVGDRDAGNELIEVRVGAPSGQVYLSDATGLVNIESVSDADGQELRFQGTLADLNSAFAAGHVQYRTLIGEPDATANDKQITVVIDDLGHTGAGGPLTASTVVRVSVLVECSGELN